MTKSNEFSVSSKRKVRSNRDSETTTHLLSHSTTTAIHHDQNFNDTHENSTSIPHTTCVTRPTTTPTTRKNEHRRKKRNAAETTTSETNSNTNFTGCVILPEPDTGFISFQITLAVLLSLFFILVYFILNFCSKELCIQILRKIGTASQKYIFLKL